MTERVDSHSTTPGDGSRRVSVLGVVLGYAIFAALWILLSDNVLVAFIHEPATLALASMIKGWLFVAVTAFLLFLVLRRMRAAQELADARALDDWRPRRIFIVATVIVLIMVITGIMHAVGQVKSRELARLQAIADLKSRQIETLLGEIQDDAEFLRQSGFIEGIEGDSEEAKARAWTLNLWAKKEGFQLTLLDARGGFVWGSKEVLQHIPIDMMTTRPSGRGIVRLGPTRDAQGRVHIEYIVALRPAGRVAMAVLHIDPTTWLYPLLRFWPLPSASAETLLFKRDGNDVLFLNDLVHQTDAAARLRIPLQARDELLAAQVLTRMVGQGEGLHGVDYRGVPVIGAARAITGTDWDLVTKIDRAEVFANARDEIAWVILAGLLMLAVATAGVRLLHQRHKLDLIKHVGEAQLEQLRALRLLASIADSSNDAILAKDLEGRYLFFNRAAEQITGKTAADVLGHDDFDLFPPDEARFLRKFAENVVANDRIITEEEVLTTTLGERVFLATKGPMHDEHGNIIGIFGISRDITERKRMERELAEKGMLRQVLIEQSRDGIVVINQDGGIIEANATFADMLGYSADRVLTLHPWDWDPNWSRERTLGTLTRPEQGAGIMETRWQRHDGSLLDVEIAFNRIDHDGQKLMFCVCRDISARKQAEARARKHETRYRALVDQAADALFVHDHEGRFIEVNQRACDSLGYSKEELLGMSVADVSVDFDLARAQPIWLTFQPGHTPSIRGRHQRKDGSIFPVEVHFGLLEHEDQRLYIALAHDITERERSEAALLASEYRFRALVEQSLAGIYIIQDGLLRYVNPGFATIFGYSSPDDIIDRVRVSDLVAPSNLTLVADNINKRLSGEASDIHYVFQGVKANGTCIDVEVHGRTFEYLGRPAVIGMILDITARKAAEDALRASEQRFHDIVDASADWIWEVDAEWRYTYASESVFELLGYSAVDIIGKTPFDLMPEH